MMTWDTYFFNEFVNRVRTSCFSSKSNMIPRYPRRLSPNRGLATSFRHSIWPKWAGEPSIWIYKSFAMLLCRAYTSSSLNDARIAADSCWMRARSSATVCKGLSRLYDSGIRSFTLQALIPLINAILKALVQFQTKTWVTYPWDCGAPWL